MKAWRRTGRGRPPPSAGGCEFRTDALTLDEFAALQLQLSWDLYVPAPVTLEAELQQDIASAWVTVSSQQVAGTETSVQFVDGILPLTTYRCLLYATSDGQACAQPSNSLQTGEA